MPLAQMAPPSLVRERLGASRGVQPDPVPDPPAQPVRSGPRTGRPDAGDGRRRIPDPKIRVRRVG